MKETKWTKEQQNAIETSGANILVAAGAGAGKTAVLVQRIIEKILNEEKPVDIDRLLIVTFTNAAASEMRERIGDAISAKLDENPSSKLLQRQLTLLTRASITTIHSFCLSVIRNNFHKINLDPSFKVCDETESILMKNEALEEIFEENFDNTSNEDFLRLVESFSGKDDKRLQEIVYDLYNFSVSTPWPEKWLLSSAENFNVGEDFNFYNSKWAMVLLEDIKLELDSCKKKLKKALNIVENANGVENYIPYLTEDLTKVEKILEKDNLLDIKKDFESLEFSAIKTRGSKDADKESRERAKVLRDEVKSILLKIKDEVFMDESIIKNNFKELYPLMKELSNLVIGFKNIYSIKKKEKGLIDFNDIEHFCLQILTNKDQNGEVIFTEIAEYYKEYYEEILIDEYQDSNLVQEAIMQAIARKDTEFKEGERTNNLFMVGDVKQSIYRFRAAKPELFLQKYTNYSENLEDREVKIKLFKNFRSRKEIIDGVNYIFKQIMSKNVGELEYDEREEIEAAADYKEPDSNFFSIKGPIDIMILNKEVDKENRDLEEEEVDFVSLEGKMICEKIKEIVSLENNYSVFDKKINSYRRVTYKDIVVLFRATSKWAPVFIEEFNKNNIPVFADSNTGYFDTIEIKTMVSLLQIIDNPYGDIPMLAVLRSPIGGFTIEEMIDIRLIDKNICYYEAMKKAIETDSISKDIKIKIKGFLDTLNDFREKAVYFPLDEFIWHIYITTGYYGFVSAMPNGEQRAANLRILFERAKIYEKTSYKGLFNFITFISRLKNSSGDMGSAKILGENENLVRIMSIHKSKGLEFPVVILAGCGKQFNLSDTNKNILFHSELGFGPDYVNIERRLSYPTVMKKIIRKKISLETLSEELRILYVALTRAKEKLIISGGVKDLEKTLSKWYEAAIDSEEKIDENYVQSSKNYLDLIGASLMRHKDGEALRKIIDKSLPEEVVKDDSSLWSFKVVKSSELQKNEEIKEEFNIVEELEKLLINREKDSITEKVYEKLSFKYKFEKSSIIPAKISVSELKRKFGARFLDEEEENIYSNIYLKKPRFLEEEKALTAAERGSLIHLVMQKINIEKTNSLVEINSELERLVNSNFISKESLKYINTYKVLNFFNSDLGIRMKKSKNLNREIPFKIYLKSTDIYKDLEEETYKDEKVLLHGVIDCFFVENKELVLIDYKTDYVKESSEIVKKYKMQLELYSKALKEITGLNVKEKYIYLFSIEESIEIE